MPVIEEVVEGGWTALTALPSPKPEQSEADREMVVKIINKFANTSLSLRAFENQFGTIDVKTHWWGTDFWQGFKNMVIQQYVVSGRISAMQVLHPGHFRLPVEFSKRSARQFH